MLKTLEDIRLFFSKNTVPIYFVSPTPFNLLGMDQYVGCFYYVSYIDTFDGQHAKVIIPKRLGTPVFNHLEDINQYLLSHKQVVEQIDRDSQILFLFFDSTLEAICRDLKVDIALSPYAIVHELDSKLVTTQVGNSVGVNSVPNVLAHVDSYVTLKELAFSNGLGDQWVIQSAFGDSGKTTYFVSNEEDYRRYSAEIEAEEQVKIMKRIRCVSAAIEACATSKGIFVGPLMRELIGVPSLTPFPGGWCGNDLHTNGFSLDIRRQAMEMTEKLGAALYDYGYRGYFEVDYLLDLDSNRLYLGELNPRFSGVSAMTNLSPFCQTSIPLFLFHLLDFLDVPFSIDSKMYNRSVLASGAKGETGQLILKYTDSALKFIVKAPVSGVYTTDVSGQLCLKCESTNRLDASGPDEVFVFRILTTGDYVYHGADLAIVFLNGVLMGPKLGVTDFAKRWIALIQGAFIYRDLTGEEQAILDRYQHPGALVKGDG